MYSKSYPDRFEGCELDSLYRVGIIVRYVLDDLREIAPCGRSLRQHGSVGTEGAAV